jgi:hypothetical protein
MAAYDGTGRLARGQLGVRRVGGQTGVRRLGHQVDVTHGLILPAGESKSVAGC